MKTSKKAITLVLLIISVLTMSLTFTGCGAKKTDSVAENLSPYKIGAIFHITGRDGSMGVPQRDSIQMLANDINAQGGINGHKIELIIIDDESNQTKAVLAAKQLVDVHNVLAIIGSTDDNSSLAIYGVAEKAGITQISPTAGKVMAEPVAERKYAFKTSPNSYDITALQVSYVKKINASKVALLIANHPFGQEGSQGFKELIKGTNIEVIAEEKFELSDNDMTPQLTRVKAAKPDAVVVWMAGPAATSLTKNYRQLGITAPLISSSAIAQQSFIDTTGKDADGIVHPAAKLLVAESLPDSDFQKKVLVDFVKAYEAKYGPRSQFAANTYDALNLIVNAIKSSGSNPTPAKIRDEVEKNKNYIGVMGTYNYSPTNHVGLGTDGYTIVKIENGKWKKIE